MQVMIRAGIILHCWYWYQTNQNS